MPSAETEADDTTSEETELIDEGRNALLEAVTAELGDALADTHLIPGRDLWLRVSNEAWAQTADYLRNRQRFRFFNWLSAIDWMDSPYGRSLDSAVDNEVGVDIDDADAGEATPDEPTEPVEPSGAASAAGGETRFQVIGRVYNLSTRLGVTVKADVDDDVAIDTWTNHFPGADWHEREAWEMFGISFRGHPGLRNLYLPGDFEGHPLRKDYPLLARMVKPWPGIIDVEPMPEASDANDKPSTTNPEAK